MAVRPVLLFQVDLPRDHAQCLDVFSGKQQGSNAVSVKTFCNSHREGRIGCKSQVEPGYQD